MIANLVPACDRCGHTTDTDKLAYDGLGMVCGACRPQARKPRRIQLRRTAGWRKPSGAISVARPSKWGNPFAVGSTAFIRYGGSITSLTVNSRAHAVALYRNWQADPHWILAAGSGPPKDFAEIRGHDLACWCPLDGQPCHADVLLELANQRETAQWPT